MGTGQGKGHKDTLVEGYTGDKEWYRRDIQGQTGDTQGETKGHRATYAWGPESGVERHNHDKLLTYHLSYSLADERA